MVMLYFVLIVISCLGCYIARLADAVDVAAFGSDHDQAVPHRGGGLDAGAQRDAPQLGRLDRRVAHVEGVEPASAVSHTVIRLGLLRICVPALLVSGRGSYTAQTATPPEARPASRGDRAQTRRFAQT